MPNQAPVRVSVHSLAFSQIQPSRVGLIGQYWYAPFRYPYVPNCCVIASVPKVAMLRGHQNRLRTVPFY